MARKIRLTYWESGDCWPKRVNAGGWNVQDGEDPFAKCAEIPLTEDEAKDLAEIGEMERRIDDDGAIAASKRIVDAYPANANRDISGYMNELTDELIEWHPDVVYEVCEGDGCIQRSEKFSPTVKELREALQKAQRRRFGTADKARIALALYAAKGSEAFRVLTARHKAVADRWCRAIGQGHSDDGDGTAAIELFLFCKTYAEQLELEMRVAWVTQRIADAENRRHPYWRLDDAERERFITDSKSALADVERRLSEMGERPDLPDRRRTVVRRFDWSFGENGGALF